MDLKELVKSHISLIQNLQFFPSKFAFRLHFINIYVSFLANLQVFYAYFLNSLKTSHEIPLDSIKSLQKTLEILNNQQETLKKLEKSGFFYSFGLNIYNKDSLFFLYKSSNAVLDILEKARYFELNKQAFSLIKLPEKDLEKSLNFLDLEVQKASKLRANSLLDFNGSLRHIQNDLAYVFFIKQLESLGNPRKRLIKRLDFITGFQKFIKEFEPDFAFSTEQLWIIEKKLGMKESLTSSKIDEFFSEIWGNINERIKVLGYKKSSEEFNRGMTEFFERKTSREEKSLENKREIEDFFIEEEKPLDFQGGNSKKELIKKKSCMIY
jgi:hypothetical protein